MGLTRRHSFQGEMVARTPLFVGDPTARGPYDRLLLRGSAGTVFVPASTLRGALRASIEGQLLALDGRDVPPVACRGPSGASHWARGCARGKDLCDVCRLFGCRGHAGAVTVWDASPKGAIVTDLRAAIPRHRELGTARKEDGCEWEVIAPGSAFEVRIEIDEAQATDVGLLAAAIDGVNRGLVVVGGGRGRGFGRVDLKVTRVQTTDLSAFLTGTPANAAPTIVDGADQVSEWMVPHVNAVATVIREGESRA